MKEHFAEAPLPDRTQVCELSRPGRLLERATTPDGVTALPEAVSVTVTVQKTGEFARTEVLLHESEVEVARKPPVAVTVSDAWPELPMLLASPA